VSAVDKERCALCKDKLCPLEEESHVECLQCGWKMCLTCLEHLRFVEECPNCGGDLEEKDLE